MGVDVGERPGRSVREDGKEGRNVPAGLTDCLGSSTLSASAFSSGEGAGGTSIVTGVSPTLDGALVYSSANHGAQGFLKLSSASVGSGSPSEGTDPPAEDAPLQLLLLGGWCGKRTEHVVWFELTLMDLGGDGMKGASAANGSCGGGSGEAGSGKRGCFPKEGVTGECLGVREKDGERRP